MAEPKQKPKMGKPKLKNSDSALPKDAKRMLAKEYRDLAGEWANDTKQRPEQEAVEQVEDGMRSRRDHALAAAKRGVKGLKQRGCDDGSGAPTHSVKGQPRKRSGQPARDGGRAGSTGGHASGSTDNASGAVSPEVKERIRQGARKDAVQGRLRRSNTAQRSVHAGGDAPGPPATSLVTPQKNAGQPVVKDRKSVRPVDKTKAKKGAFRLKTSRNVASRAKKSAKAVAKLKRQAQMVAKAAQKAAKVAIAFTKKVAVMIQKVAAAAVKALVSALGPVGAVILVFVVIAAVAVILASPLGLFYSGEDEDSKAAMQQTVAAISYEYHGRLQEIIRSNAHDEMRFEFINHGYLRTDNWIDVLAIYAVKTANFDDGMDVVELDDTRKAILRSVFWDMEDISYKVENEPIYDADTDTYTDHYILYIMAECIGAWTMAGTYRFSNSQREVLAEMLNGDYDQYFEEMIGSAGLFMSIGDGGEVVGTGNFIWPSAASTYVTSPFGTRVHPITGAVHTHLGIDISAGAGTGVLASDGGTVVSNNVHSSYGIHLLIDHGNGYKTLYAHMSVAHVGVGDSVEQGQVIGLVGSTGVSTNPHLHFEVRAGGTHIDPLGFFDNYMTAW